MKLFAVFVGLILLTSLSNIWNLIFDPSQDEITGESSTHPIKDWFYNLVYHNRIEPSIFQKSIYAQAVGDKRSIIIKISKSNLNSLSSDFDFSYSFLFNTTTHSYLSAYIEQSIIAKPFWDELIDFWDSSTLADKDYIDWIKPNRQITLIEPATMGDLTPPDELGMTTYELCEHYGILDCNYTGEGVTVAVLDTGVDLGHPGINDNTTAVFYATNSPNDKQGHGTHCIGILAGLNISISNNTFRGVAPNVTLHSVKVLDDKGRGTESDIIEGINYSIGIDADIVSMSLGGFINFQSALHDIIRYATGKGITFICASGNSGSLFSTQPASWSECISVGSLSEDGNIAFYSNLFEDINAIGTNISSLKANSNKFITFSGTSMSTPFVVGVVALAMEANPTLMGKPSKIKEHIKSTGGYIPYKKSDLRIWYFWNFESFHYDSFEVNIDNFIDLEARSIDSSREELSDVWWQIHRG